MAELQCQAVQLQILRPPDLGKSLLLAGLQGHPPDMGPDLGNREERKLDGVQSGPRPRAGAGPSPWDDRPGDREGNGQPAMEGVIVTSCFDGTL